jgi:predicted nucleic acid-binding protein
MNTIRTHLLDSSALVKLLVKEDKSDLIRSYFDTHSVFWTTSFCFAETLGVLKRKWLTKSQKTSGQSGSQGLLACLRTKAHGGSISQDQYLSASEELAALVRNESISIEEVQFTQRSVFDQAEDLAKKYGIDLVDSFQLVTLMIGFPSAMPEESRTILITADKGLAKAARSEGLRSWYFMKEPIP